jgi:transcription elongation factor GreB
MGRYRPPAPPKSPYITRAGFEALSEESRGLWVRRREVTAALAAAAAEGDRSENAEYIYRKKELRELDRRIRYLEKRLPQLQVVDSAPADPERIYFGAWVSLENSEGGELKCRIVGPDEIDTSRNWISIDAPLARALLKHRLDDEIRVTTPNGNTCYWVLSIHYDPDQNHGQ